MSDYIKKMRDGSREYRLGRQGKTPYDLDNWSHPALADYNKGKADAAKLRRRLRRKNRFENLVAIPAAIVALVGVFVGFALLAALPVIIVLVVAKILFF